MKEEREKLNKILGAAMSEEMIEKIIDVATKRDRSKSYIVREAMKQFLADESIEFEEE